MASLDHVAVTRVEHQVGTLAVERPELPTQAHDPDRVVCARFRTLGGRAGRLGLLMTDVDPRLAATIRLAPLRA